MLVAAWNVVVAFGLGLGLVVQLAERTYLASWLLALCLWFWWNIACWLSFVIIFLGGELPAGGDAARR